MFVLYNLLKAYLFRRKVRNIFLEPLMNKHSFSICKNNGHMSFIWYTFNLTYIKSQPENFEAIKGLKEYENLPMTDKIKKGNDAYLLLTNSLHQNNNFVYICYDELNIIDKVKSSDVFTYKYKRPDAYIIDSEWKWIYMMSHEEGEQGFDIGPYYYSFT